MNTPEPIKRHEAILSFSKDHHFGLLFVWKIRQGLKKAIDIERIGKYVLFFFKEDLEKHFLEEEELLFSKLADDDKLRIKAEADHQEIRGLVGLIAENKYTTVLLYQLAVLVEMHIRFEERELFNCLQQNCKDEDLALIAKRFSNSSKSKDEKWEDDFWDSK